MVNLLPCCVSSLFVFLSFSSDTQEGSRRLVKELKFPFEEPYEVQIIKQQQQHDAVLDQKSQVELANTDTNHIDNNKADDRRRSCKLPINSFMNQFKVELLSS